MKKDLRKPIIEYELVDGQEKILHYFATATEVTKYYKQADPPLNIWQSLISLCCNGKVKWAKKHRFRFASPEEVAAMAASLKIIEITKREVEAIEKNKPIVDDLPEQEPEEIPAITEKPVSDDGLTPFERMLQKMRGE